MGKGEARVTRHSVYSGKTPRKIAGTEVSRTGSSDDPALYIRYEACGTVLKRASGVGAGPGIRCGHG